MSSYPTMPRPEDNTGDDHRAAITALEGAIREAEAHHREERERRDSAQRVVTQALAEMGELERQRAALRRGIDALKAAQP